MLQLNKKVEYGLIAILHLDSMQSSGLATAKEVAEQYRIPPELLGKVLQKLAKQQIVESVHGAKGGYRLTKPLEQLTLGHVIEALEGPVQLTRCQDEPASCDQFCACNIREPVMRIQIQLTRFINHIQLSSFRHSAHVSGSPIEIV